MSFLFLKKDLDQLKAKRELINTQYREAGKEAGEAATQGETTHDNAPFDQAMHEMHIKGQQLAEIDGVLREAQIISPPQSNGSVTIGHLVRVLDTVAKHETWYILGSYITNANSASAESEDGTKERPYTASYFSPIGRLINGRVLSESFDLKLPSQPPRKMRIVEITQA